MEVQLKALVNERNSTKALLIRFKKFFEESKHSETLTVLKKRYEMCGSLYNKYVHAQESIEQIVPGIELESLHAAHRNEFENAYFNIMAAVKEFIEYVRARQQRKKDFSSLIVTQQQYPSILPQIKLPIFDGTLKNWISFRDTFVSLVQNNEFLSNLQKFYYLRGLLKDCAARIIQSLGVSEEN